MRRFFRSRSGPILAGGILAVLAGSLFGLGLFTFGYAKGMSYLSEDPNTCVNCHVMRDEFNAWQHSSHKTVAVCDDCHLPHDFAGKWFTKALNGFNHSLAFTTGNFPNTIHVHERNANVVQANCINCHQTMISQVYSLHTDQERRCVACHGNVGHDNRPYN